MALRFGYGSGHFAFCTRAFTRIYERRQSARIGEMNDRLALDCVQRHSND
jgi:hypothetical protein